MIRPERLGGVVVCRVAVQIEILVPHEGLSGILGICDPVLAEFDVSRNATNATAAPITPVLDVFLT